MDETIICKYGSFHNDAYPCLSEKNLIHISKPDNPTQKKEPFNSAELNGPFLIIHFKIKQFNVLPHYSIGPTFAKYHDDHTCHPPDFIIIDSAFIFN